MGQIKFVASLGLFLMCAHLLHGQQSSFVHSSTSSTAFVDVNVVPMDSERVVPNQTVLIQGERISEIGPAYSVKIPPGAVVIDGRGQYLMPGLADMHVHLEGRSQFGDAPLFLAYGITTVLNMRGRPEILGWKKEIAAGTLLAPNLYTSGEFVNEPRVNTPQEARDEVIRQKEDGYDVIKFHEIVENGRYMTTHGLSRSAYDAMNHTAREIGIPLIGHAPDNLRLQAVLEDHQNLAHSGILVSLYFVPKPIVDRWMVPSLVVLGMLLLLGFGFGVAEAAFRLRQTPVPFKAESRVIIAITLLSVGFILLWPTFGLLSGSNLFLCLLSVVALLIACLTLTAGALSLRAWRSNRSWPLRIFSSIAATASLAFTLTLLVWVPIAWRCSTASINSMASKFRQAGIWVEPTLDIYQNINSMREGRSAEILKEPVYQFVSPNTLAGWKGIPEYKPQFKERAIGFLFRRTLSLSERVTGSLGNAGVPLLLSTDTFGFPFCVAGKSAHDEMDLMHDSGLSVFAVLQSATINPARFLGNEGEFGTVSVGKRADLLLVRNNPLQDLATTAAPEGVMVRGHWLSSAQLHLRLEALVHPIP